jgi:hypothetical protein
MNINHEQLDEIQRAAAHLRKLLTNAGGDFKKDADHLVPIEKHVKKAREFKPFDSESIDRTIEMNKPPNNR